MERRRRPHSSHSVLSHNNSYIRESNIDQLQRQLEIFTTHLEKEKRQSSVLDGRIRITNEDLQKIGLPVRSSTPIPYSNVSLIRESEKLERDLQLSIKSLNETQTENEIIKSEIDILRRERVLYKDMFKKLHGDISSSSTRAGELNEEINESVQHQDNTHKRAIRIRANSASVRSRFASKMEELSEGIKVKKTNRKDYARDLEERLKQSANILTDGSESNSILRKVEIK